MTVDSEWERLEVPGRIPESLENGTGRALGNEAGFGGPWDLPCRVADMQRMDHVGLAVDLKIALQIAGFALAFRLMEIVWFDQLDCFSLLPTLQIDLT